MATATGRENRGRKSSPSQSTYRTQLHTAPHVGRSARASSHTSVSSKPRRTQFDIPFTLQKHSSWTDSKRTGTFVRSAHQDVIVDLKGMGSWIEPGQLVIDGSLSWNTTASQPRNVVMEYDLLLLGEWITPEECSSPYENTSTLVQISRRESAQEAIEDWTIIELWNEKTGREGGPWNAIEISFHDNIGEGEDGKGEKMQVGVDV